MGERDLELARPAGRAFVAKSTVMSADDVRRALRRIAHEIVERNHGTDDLVVIGLAAGGTPLAADIAKLLVEIDGREVPLGSLDVSFYRDDIGTRSVLPNSVTKVPVDLTGKVVVLVDDVLFTGRTVRAALDALADHGRARAVQLAVMIDRGHRELPIRPDFVGKNLPTRRDELVMVTSDGVSLGGYAEEAS
ncbi:MAG TPA: bifunctional pyr operon transcriptional regulator/uracil phosphoribosyltransferase PyrR [Acidimicrobiales bacterium]